VGSFRECFDVSVTLGLETSPVTPQATCVPQKTQADPESTIRACLCTSDLCNGEIDVYGDDDDKEESEDAGKGLPSGHGRDG